MEYKDIYNILKSKGRFGDTELAHVTPEEKSLLKALGGSGTINPETGLSEYHGGKPTWSDWLGHPAHHGSTWVEAGKEFIQDPIGTTYEFFEENVIDPISEQFGYGDTGDIEKNYYVSAGGNSIDKKVSSEDWQGGNIYSYIFNGVEYSTEQQAKDAITEFESAGGGGGGGGGGGVGGGGYTQIDFSNLRNDPNWRQTLLDNAIFAKGSGNITAEDLEKMKKRLEQYSIEDIIDAEKEQLIEDKYTLATDKEKLTRDKGISSLRKDAYNLGKLKQGTFSGMGGSMRNFIGGTQNIGKEFGTTMDTYGLGMRQHDITRRGQYEVLEDQYETTLGDQFEWLFPDVFGNKR